MKKEQERNWRSEGKQASGKRKAAYKKPRKDKDFGNTDILDLDLIEEEMEQPEWEEQETGPEEPQILEDRELERNESKDAVKEYGEKMPERPVSLDTEALELLDVDTFLDSGKGDLNFGSEKRKRAEGKKKAASRSPKREEETINFEKHAAARKKKKRGSDFNAMDMVIALTGVLVLFVGAVALGIYRNAGEVKKQVAAMASVGEKMEQIGIAGEGVFVAVADARMAAQDILDLESEAELESEEEEEYVEKDLVTDVSVALKLTSVQKDLKIKFTNKASGKLIGNQAFSVKIDGPESMTKTDDDKDGIIYIKSIKPGEYTVTITAPDEIDGKKVSGIKELVTVKDKIEYKKIDVTDEVKKESEINAAKEDTAVVNQVESVLTDTVEWVESTKTPIGGGSVSYEEVNKSDIPDPSSSARLDMIWTADGVNGAYLSYDTVKLEENAASAVLGAVNVLEKGVYFSETIPPETTPAESDENTFEVTGVSISGGGTYDVGTAVTLTAKADTTGEGSLKEEDYAWSGDLSGSGTSIKVPTDSAKTYHVTVTVKGKSADATVEIKEKPAEVKVTGVSVSADQSRMEVGKNATVTATVSMSDGSSYSGNIDWSANNGGQISGSGASVTLTSSAAGKVDVTAKAGEFSGSTSVEFYVPDKKVSSIKIPDSISVVVGATANLSVTEVQPSDAKDKSVSWKVTSGGDVVSVDGNGVIKGLKAGTAKVQATAKDGSNVVSNTCTVTVSADIGVTLESPGTMTVGDGEKKIRCVTSGEIASVEWSISNNNVIEVIAKDNSNCKVKAKAAGKVTVTVKVKGKNGKEAKASCELTVNEAKAEIKLDPTSLSLKVGEKKTVKATVNSNSNKAVEWKSKDESVLKVVESKDDSCTVQAMKPGKAELVATSKADKSKTATCAVTVEVKDGTAALKDKNGNQLYYKDGDTYREATVADYYKYDKFYRKKDTANYKYTGWQNIDGKRYYFDKNGNPVTGDQVIQGMKYTFNSDGSLKVNGSMGIDVSKHNGNIDWNAVKNAGVNFVIIRCGYRGSATGVLVEDPKFKSNIQGAAAAGLKVGIYFFSQAVNEVEAVEEASMTASLIRKYKITYPVYVDVEAANGRADGLDSNTRTQVIKAFCETIRNSGYTAGIYANKTWLGSKMNVGALGSYRIWLAQYASTPTYSGRYEMWQYSSKGKIPGISTNVDLNMSYMSY